LRERIVLGKRDLIPSICVKREKRRQMKELCQERTQDMSGVRVIAGTE
jgi:hypothetical protein